MEYIILETEPTAGYELIDAGEGEKLERFGEMTVRRPDPQALWRKAAPQSEWASAKAVFEQRSGEKGGWAQAEGFKESWVVDIGGIKFKLKPAAFKHVGVFPEQQPNWQWAREQISGAGRGVSVLNLFGYTGGATLAALQAGAEVCHLDGSRTALAAARDNATLTGVADKPVRWILDDARLFIKREIKRGRKYDAIIMDPPAFGHGPGGELWKIEDDFLPFLDLCVEVMSDNPLFFLINGYASGYSAIAYENNLKNIFKSGKIESGELVIADRSGRRLPAGIFSRWSSAR